MDGSDVVADGLETEVDRGADWGAVFQSAHDQLTGGGRIHHSGGDYPQTSTPTISNNDITVTGVGNDSNIRADSTLNSHIKIQDTGSTTFRPKIMGLRFNGNGNITNPIEMDSSTWGEIKSCFAEGYSGHFISATSDQSGRVDGWEVYHNRIAASGSPSGFASLSAGSAGAPTDWVFRFNSIAGLDGWGYKLVDCEDIKIDRANVGNNSSTFSGGVLVQSDGSAAGAVSDIVGIEIYGLHVENRDGTNSAVPVKIEATTTDPVIQQPRVESLQVAPNTMTGVQLRDNSGSTRKVRGATIRDLNYNPAASDTVDIGSNVFKTSVEFHGEPSKLDGVVTNNGDFTVLNGHGSESANAETPDSTKWEVGDIIGFTDSGDGSGTGTYILAADGTWTQLA